MSLVSNFVGNISSSGIAGLKQNQSFDLSDNTFSDLLEKQMQAESTENTNNIFASLGMPAGMQIESIDFSKKDINQTSSIIESTDINKIENTNPIDLDSNNQITTSEAVTFFTSLLSNNQNGIEARSELFDFAKKQASNFYNQHSRSVVTDIQEFVEDIHELIK